MNAAFVVHSPSAAHPAHDGAFVGSSAHKVGAVVGALDGEEQMRQLLAQLIAMNAALLAHSPALAQPAHDAALEAASAHAVGAVDPGDAGSVQSPQLLAQLTAMNAALLVHSLALAHPGHDAALVAASAHVVGVGVEPAHSPQLLAQLAAMNAALL
jgi:hypothetical protein